MPIPKKIRMLEVLAQHPYGLTKLEAIDHGDTCINSTVASLSAKYQLKFTRVPATVHDRFGGKTQFVRYKLDGEQRELALNIVRRYRNRTERMSGQKKAL